MSIINRTDVKGHLRSPFLSKIHLCEPQSESDATGFSESVPDAMDVQPSGFAADFVAEHSLPGLLAAPDHHLPGSFHREEPIAPKSAKA